MKETKNEIAIQLNNVVGNVLTQTHLQGFERAFLTATAIGQLKEMLTPEYMAPIMQLQDNKLGFLTDKSKNGGYPEAVVKNCLIEAVLMGLQPYGNQFNIIAGQSYPTKEGLGFVLNNWSGLKYTIIPGIPEVRPDGKSAIVPMTIKWTLNNKNEEVEIPISVKSDAYASVDSLIGKATRKSRAWLLSNISGIEVVDADVQDIPHVEIPADHKQISKNKEYDRIVAHIEKSKDIKTLSQVRKALDENDGEMMLAYTQKWIEVAGSVKDLEKCKSAISDEDLVTIVMYDDKLKGLKALEKKNG